MPFFRWLFFRRPNSFFPTTAYASLFERIAHETWPCVGRGFSLLTPLPTWNALIECSPALPYWNVSALLIFKLFIFVVAYLYYAYGNFVIEYFLVFFLPLL